MTNQTVISRHLRRNMTDAERVLWRHLRLHQIKGYKFRRQHPWRSYVLDFVCLEAKLIIEVDGGQHQQSQNSDSHRTSKLEAEGFRVLRFWNNDVLTNVDGVTAEIRKSLPDEISPHPNLPPCRGKEVLNMSISHAKKPEPSPPFGGRQDGGNIK